MQGNLYPNSTSEPGYYESIVRFAGAGAANPTKLRGNGCSIAWISTGLYEITWSENPGIFAGLDGAPAFEADTAADLKGYTCVAGAYSSSTFKLRLSVTDASNNLVDLTSSQRLTAKVGFKLVNV